MIRRNNEGASLLFIIACIAVVTVVGMTILLAVTQNRGMVLLEKKARETFYEADEVSDELVMVLEALAQEAVAEAYTDYLLQYEVAKQEALLTGISAEGVRLQRYYAYFAEVLEEKLLATGSLQDLFADALGIPDPEAIGLSISCEGIGVETESYPVEGELVERKKLRLRKVELSITLEDGYQTKITTDVLISPGHPGEGVRFTAPGENSFSTFALLSKGDVQAFMPSGQSILIDGSVYSGGSLRFTEQNVSVTMQNATRVLVKDKITVEKARLSISNTDTEAYTGIWADGIELRDGGSLFTDANCYVADDLELTGTGTEAVFSGAGKSYVGYSGGGTGTADNSAVLINNATEVTLDFSGLGELCLTGNAYIRDEVWGNVNPGEVSQTLGVLQGESVAYKEMQTAYLLPGECLTTGCNPMLQTAYDAAGGTVDACVTSYVRNTKKNGVEIAWNLRPYLDPVKPVTTRYVQFDGGTTVYVYVYLNFASEQAAASYFREYLTTAEGEELVNRLGRTDALGTNSTIKLAQQNYLVGNGIVYDENGFHTEAPAGTVAEQAKLVNGRVLAKSCRDSLFYGLNPNAAAGTAVAGYDVVTDRILNMDAIRAEGTGLQKKSVTVDGVSYDFYIYNGEGSVCTVTENAYVRGIVLVNGTLNISATNFTVDGLVIATEGVIFTSGATLTANGDIVSKLLTTQEVGRYFSGYENGEQEAVSPEVVELTFENWQKN